MTPEEIPPWLIDHEETFKDMSEPTLDPSNVSALSTDRLRVRMASGTSGAVAARKELTNRVTAQLRQEMAGRVA